LCAERALSAPAAQAVDQPVAGEEDTGAREVPTTTAPCSVALSTAYESGSVGAACLAAGFFTFAAGAILTMLADTLMSEAYSRGGMPGGLVRALAFAWAFSIPVLN